MWSKTDAALGEKCVSPLSRFPAEGSARSDIGSVNWMNVLNSMPFLHRACGQSYPPGGCLGRLDDLFCVVQDIMLSGLALRCGVRKRLECAHN